MENKEDLKLTPNTNYAWDPTTVFPLDGTDFSVLFNSLSAIVGSMEFQKRIAEANETMMLRKMYDTLEKKLAESVLKGDSRVVKPEQPQVDQDQKAADN